MPDNWRSVELKHLRALREVARTRTFWAASVELNTSLSTVSDHIGALEALVGQRLIERSRGRRTVELTEAGRLLLAHTEAIEARLHAAEADFRAYAAGTFGGLRVGIYQSVANKVLPDTMRRFKARWPDVNVEVTEGNHDVELVDAVERGALDMTFAIQPAPEGPFEVRELMRDPYVLVVAASAAKQWTGAAAADLDGAAMVGYQPGKHQDMAEDFLHGLGVRPRFVFRSHDNGTLQAMVTAGLGVALSPLLAVDTDDPKVRILQLAEPVPPRVLTIVWHRDRYRPPAASAFVDTAVAVAAEVEAEQAALIAKIARSPKRARRRRSRLPASRPERHELLAGRADRRGHSR
jgi:molybdate transport repressor ModE-like protein